MTDVIEWTPEGREALAIEHTWGIALCREHERPELRDTLEQSLVRYLPCWERGLAKADEIGRAAVAHARTWHGGATPHSLSIDDAAGLLSLVGARSDNELGPLAEILLREQGLAFVVCVLVRMWSMASNYDDPDWPSSEDRLAIWLVNVAEGVTPPSWINDASVSYAKRYLASYLGKLCRISSGPERAELLAAVREAWPTAPLWARPALAVAACDRTLGELAARQLFAASISWHPHYAYAELPLLVTDPMLLDRLGFASSGQLTLRFLENMGIAALPIYAKRYAGKLSKYEREQLTLQLVNIRGPQTAKLLAPFAEKAPFAAPIRAYFTRYPELLSLLRADNTLVKHAEQLDKLAAKIAKSAKPAKKRRSSTA